MIINAEFKALIPALQEEEYKQLEQNILRDGCRDPLVLWNETLIDGHNRHEICTKHGLNFKKVQVQGINNHDEAKLWICRNQLGRRNLTDYQRTEVALIAKPLIEARAKENQKGGQGGVLLSQNSAEAKPIETREVIAEMAGVSRDTVRKVEAIKESGSEELQEAARKGKVSISVASDIATLPKEDQKEIVARGEKEILQIAKDIRAKKAEEKKEERKAILNEQRKAIEEGTAKLPDGVFEVIAIDPPWNYGREYDPDGSRIANPYPEMNQSELLALNPPFAEDAVLFLWTTHQFIWDAKELLDKWGFTYKANLVWDKEKIGMGAWLRMQCEFCLVGIKGNPVWDNTTWRDIIREPRREHSRKPDIFYQMVDQITVGRKLDFFSRENRNGWYCFGNDLGKFDNVG